MCDSPSNSIIFGPYGSGKTHRLIGQVNNELVNDPDSIIVYGVLTDRVQQRRGSRKTTQIELFKKVKRALVTKKFMVTPISQWGRSELQSLFDYTRCDKRTLPSGNSLICSFYVSLPVCWFG